MMARAKRARAGAASITITPSEPTDAEPGDGLDDQTADALAAGADEGQKVPRARVTRWNEGMRAYATLAVVPASQVDESWISDTYGGGKYLVYFWGTRADGSYGYLKGKGKEFVIDDSVPFRGAGRERVTAESPAGAPSSLLDMGMLQIFKTMQDNSALMMSMMRDNSTAQAAMLERIAAPREGAMDKMLPLLIPLFTTLITGMQNKKDPMDIAREFAVLMKQNEGPSTSVKDTMSALRDMIELREMLGGGDTDGEGRWIGLLEKVVPGALAIVQAEAEKTGRPLLEVARRGRLPAGSPSPTPAPPMALSAPTTSPSMDSASSAAPASPAPAPTETAPVTDEWTPLEPYVAQLAALAMQNKDPYGVMQMIKTLASAPMLAAVRELVVREDCAQVLMQRFPVLQQHSAWTEQLLDEFYADFFPDEEDEPETAAELGATDPDDGSGA